MPLKKTVVFETTFATYQGTDIIGEGGSGRIYLAVDDEGNNWAIKLLDSDKATKEKIKRFKNELMFCFNNSHENIVSVVDHGIFKKGSQSAPFYVMPCYESSLRSLIRDQLCPVRDLHKF